MNTKRIIPVIAIAVTSIILVAFQQEQEMIIYKPISATYSNEYGEGDWNMPEGFEIRVTKWRLLGISGQDTAFHAYLRRSKDKDWRQETHFGGSLSLNIDEQLSSDRITVSVLDSALHVTLIYILEDIKFKLK